MDHSITLETTLTNSLWDKDQTVNTYEDWYLIPATRPTIAVPSVRTQYIDVPGADGSLDLTSYLGGEVRYQNRSGSLQFYVEPDHVPWTTLYQTITNWIHGKEIKMVLQDDPSWYYKGRLSMNQWSSGKNFSSVQMNYTLDPYKYQMWQTDEDWIWDIFNFDVDYARDWYDIKFTDKTTIQFYWTRKTASPYFVVDTSDGNGICVWKATSYNESTGKWTWGSKHEYADNTNGLLLSALTFTEGINVISIYAKGYNDGSSNIETTISIRCREGSL